MNAHSTRPRSLFEVARRVAGGEQGFDTALLEFLDSYYANPKQCDAAIRQQPAPLDALRDAYVAAVAEHLARTCGLEIPAWAENQGLDLTPPFFAGKLESLEARLALESPPRFVVGCSLSARTHFPGLGRFLQTLDAWRRVETQGTALIG
jgi:hypothetical protein